MQCPSCGYDGISVEACFCPQCRFQFQEPENDVIFEYSHPGAPAEPLGHRVMDSKFTRKEIRQLEVIALQPAILVMLAIAGILYTAIGRMQDLAVTAAGIEIRYGGLLCLLTGAVIAWIFYRVVLYRAE